MHLTGTGTAMNLDEAARLFNESASHGYAAAYNGLGVLYFSGEYYERDYVRARHFFEMASELGNSDSTFNLGVIHKYGLGTPVDHDKALDYFEDAFDMGHWKGADM